MSGSRSITELEQVFLENGEIHIEGRIDETTADYVHQCMLYLQIHGAPNIKVLIRSHGGEIEPALEIYDAFRHYAGEVKGIVRGFAHSSASVLLQGCTERLAYRHATLLVHDGSFITHLRLEDLTDINLAEMKKDMRESVKHVHALLTHHTKLDIKKVRALMAQDKKLAAREALKLGLIDDLC